ncbi:hypothetical protein DFQ12_5237 [Sphingobacterium detergens]|uniref:Uncharacterized protein n=1 Tax=Sphingobacterium detergens TaxID=1145106 RepID=A0A420AGC8_SPHD1|nr:hypothetical protein DFQ12_5237 [Sphingobacterium detergens]
MMDSKSYNEQTGESGRLDLESLILHYSFQKTLMAR